MQFRGERDAILAALTNAGRAASSRNGQPLHLALIGSQLSVIGTDYDLTIESVVSVASTTDGTVNLPPRLTTDIVKAFDPGAVEFAAKDDETIISSGRAEFSVRNLNGAESRSTAVDGDALDIPAAPFAEGLRQVRPAALTDDTRAPQLTGVLMQHRDGGIRMVATDSYRLALRDIPAIASIGTTDDVLIPARALSELQRLIGDAESISFVRDEHMAKFVIDNTTITTRLLAGPFPDYERLIPESYPSSFTCDRTDLINAIKRVRVVIGASKDTTTPVRLQIDDGSLTLSVKTAESGTATDNVDGKLVGESTLIAVNPNYFLDGLDAITGEDATIKVIDASKPMSIGGSNDGFQYLQMPVRIS